MLQPIIQNKPIDQNPAAVYISALGPGSRRAMQQALGVMAEIMAGAEPLTMPWEKMRYQHAAALRQKLIERYKPGTVNKFMAALRGVLKQAWLLGAMTAEDFQKAAAVEGVKDQSLPAGRELSQGEIAALMRACKNSPRDAAVIALLYAAGLRRAEVVGLDLADVDLEKGELVIRGKGNKERLGHLSNGGLAALQDWVAMRGNKPGPLFYGITKGGVMGRSRISTQAIYTMLQRRAKQADVAAFSPHDLRRSFVGHLLSAGADISLVAKMAGHASVSTTTRYDRRGEIEKAKASTLLHLPYKRIEREG